MIQDLAVIGVANFLFIYTKAFQQLNVMNHKVAWVIPTSQVMAVFEVAYIYETSQAGYWAIIPCGIGGGIGCITAMETHRRMRR